LQPEKVPAVFQVMADVIDAFAELPGDFASGPPVHDQLDHLSLRRCQTFEYSFDILLVFPGNQAIIKTSVDDEVAAPEFTGQALTLALPLLDEEVDR
jgi:hypothetical protein